MSKKNQCKYYNIIITSLCGKFESVLSKKSCPNGIGINKNNEIKKTQPVTTPKASGLLKKKN